MRTPIARRNLFNQPVRAAVSVGGIGFAILLMFMQLGFLGAVGDTATNLFERMDGQLVVRSPQYLHAYDPRTLSESVSRRLISHPAVHDVRAMDLMIGLWENPETGVNRPVAIVGMDPQRPAIYLPEF
ncbi:MAG: DevC protein, partial [Planctomycetota bacterium]